MNKSLAIVSEIALVFLLILAQIWFVGRLLSLFTILPLGVILLGWARRKETLKSLGLDKFQFKGFRSLWLILSGGMFIIAAVGCFENPTLFRERYLGLSLALRFASYLIPALFQQIILNGYFVNRIHLVTRKQTVTAIVAGVLFSGIHAPNPVLLAITLFGGIVSAYFFVRSRNVYVLAVAHAALAALAYCALPQGWHHGFRVGMQYSLYVPQPGDCCVPEFLRMLIP